MNAPAPELISFVADDASQALARVQEQLGPDAVVVSVRRLPAHGLARLWQRDGGIEVLAVLPSAAGAGPRRHEVPPGVEAYVPFGEEAAAAGFPAGETRRWRSLAWLESLGLRPDIARQLEGRLDRHHAAPPATAIAEWAAVRALMAESWREPVQIEEGSGRPHVFIGPPGSGKTTALCKWLTQAMLVEEHTAQVWRLDSNLANTAEFLTLHGEMMGVPVARFWSPPVPPADLLFVDLPGTEMHDAAGMLALREQLARLPAPHVHLVLNAAYDIQVLFEQFQAFAPLAPEDLIFTHLDEERHRVKLWNFVLGTNCTVRFLGAGQKVPGEFRPAGAALLFPHGKGR